MSFWAKVKQAINEMREPEVFVVDKGCKYEGGGSVGSFSSFAAAEACANYYMDKERADIELFRQTDIAEGMSVVDAHAHWMGCGEFKLTADPERGFWEWVDRSIYIIIRRQPAKRTWKEPEF